MSRFTTALASDFARLALAGLHRELPHKLDHLIDDLGDLLSPRQLHPAFYGCLDWHSAVHGHWTLIQLLRRFPDLPEADAMRAALRTTLTQDNLAAELAYFKHPLRAAFERTYGWAWLLELARALHGWDDADGRAWAAAIQPLADELSHRFRVFLPKQTYPIRTGVHANTAFALGLAIDYACTVGDRPLADEALIAADRYYATDVAAPTAWEPGGEDFLSPSLTEADLMRRVLPPERFARWVRGFLPQPGPILEPVTVSDRSDPKLAHHDGLNLSRAWCLAAIARALPPQHSLRERFAAAAERHAAAGLAHVATGDYMGEHWLATFAVYLLSSTDRA